MSNTIGNFINKVNNQVLGGHEKTEENGSGINTEDTFDKTDGEGPSIGKLTTAAGIGTVLGISLANKSELSAHNKRIEDLEKRIEEMEGKKSAAPSKNANSKTGESSQVKETPAKEVSTKEKPAESQNFSDIIVDYAKECLKQSADYSDETKTSLFKQALDRIRLTPTSTEKALARYTIKTWNCLDKNLMPQGKKYEFLCDKNATINNSRKFQVLSAGLGEEALTFLSEPKNLKGSFGKVMMNLNNKITKNLNFSDNFMTKYIPDSTFGLAVDSISQSSLSTPYEKSMADSCLALGYYYTSDDFKDVFTNCILKATNKSNPIKDMAKVVLKYESDGKRSDTINVYDKFFKTIAESSNSTDGEKALAKEGMAIGEEFHMSYEDKIKDATKILKQLAGSEE